MEKAQIDLKAVDEKIKQVKNEINDTILDFADRKIKWQRNQGIDLKKYEQSPTPVTTTSKRDIAQLIYYFRNTDDTTDKRTYAQAISNIENSAFLNAASNDQIKAREIMRDWLAKNPENVQ